MRLFRALLVTMAVMLAAWTSSAAAQSVDAAFGLNAVTASQAVQNIPKLGGGLYPSFSGDLILVHGLGFGANVAWRGSAGNYFGTPVRPIYYDFDLVWQPMAISRSIVPQFEVGIGAQSLRAYQGVLTCGTFTGCSDYFTSNHLSGHFGVGVKFYLTEHIFLRPAADFYFIRHDVEYDASQAQRFGLSIGYTLGGGQ